MLFVFMKAKQRKNKKKEGDSKTGKTTPPPPKKKTKKKIRRVKGHFTRPLSPPPQIKINFVLSKKGRLKTHMHFQTKNAEIIF